jgi:hypothetical protein
MAGLAWGLVAALVEGLPLLLEGSPWPYLGPRLLALAYLAVVYGVLSGAGGGLLGLVAAISFRLAKRPLRYPGAIVAGVLAGATAGVLGVQRFAPGPAGWAVILLLAAGLGLGTGWFLSRAAVRPGQPRVWRAAALGLFLVALVAVAGTAGFRAKLRDLPRFNPAVTGEVATPERPNIVLITAGGIRADHLGAYGYHLPDDPEISPSIDALAQRGVLFEQAFAPASWSEPSLASLITSLYPTELGIACRPQLECTPQLDAERTTLAEGLSAAGYRTQAYLTDPWLSADLGFDQGFDGFESLRVEEPFDLGPLRSGALGRLLGCRRSSAACQWFEKGYGLLFDDPIPPGWGGDRVNGRVSRFLDLHRGERFFLWVHYAEALPPYDLEPPFRPLPTGSLATRERPLKRLGYWQLGDPFTARETLLPLDVQGLASLYDAEVQRVDRLVGGLTGLITGLGLDDRTVIVFTSDHGQEFMDHGGYTYGHSLYDEVLRVPVIVAGPGIDAAGQVAPTPISLLDLGATLMQIGGAQVPAQAEGRSLVPAFRGQSLEERPVYAESLYRVPYELKSVRARGYKLIYRPGDGTVELYDVGTGAEDVDISAQENEIVASLQADLSAWMAHAQQVTDELPRAAPPTQVDDAIW